MNEGHSSLPLEVTALVHHVELHRAGWWDATLKRLVLAAVWLTEGDADKTEISRVLQDNWNLTVGSDKLLSVLMSLINEDTLVQVSNDVYRIPEVARKIFEREIADAEKAETNAREYFHSLMERACPNLDALEVWRVFEHTFLVPMVRNIGANTSRLIAGELTDSDKQYTESFLAVFGQEYRVALKGVVAKFLDPKKEDVRNYTTRMLHAYFCVEASGVSDEVLKKIARYFRQAGQISPICRYEFPFFFSRIARKPI